MHESPADQQVLLLSDTHMYDAARLPASVLECAGRAHHIVHAGDTSCLEIIRVLTEFAPVTAVRGNVESADSHAALREREVVTIGGVTIGVVHDAGPAQGRHERLAQWFPDAHVIVYGHTHMPEIRRGSDDRPWICNPGSPVQRRRAPVHTMAWLTIGMAAVVSLDLIELG